jgi:uncharacterized glyoxalase superfamily protein PhnB
MKSGTAIFVVESVAEVIKFYTEKLAFDVADMMVDEVTGRAITYVHLRKGKCSIMFRTPMNDESVEFSQLKHSIGRGAGVFAEMKKGIEKYYEKCKSRGVKVVEELKDRAWGYRTFSIKDQFGFRLTFAQPIDGAKVSTFAGYKVDMAKSESVLLDDMIRYLKDFKITRRPAKKFAKLWLKKAKAPRSKKR